MMKFRESSSNPMKMSQRFTVAKNKMKVRDFYWDRGLNMTWVICLRKQGNHCKKIILKLFMRYQSCLKMYTTIRTFKKMKKATLLESLIQIVTILYLKISILLRKTVMRSAYKRIFLTIQAIGNSHHRMNSLFNPILLSMWTTKIFNLMK